MSLLMKPSLLSLPTEIRQEILIHYLLVSASNFEAPTGIHAISFDRSLLVFCDSKAEIGSIPLSFGEIPEAKPAPFGEWPNYHLPQAVLNLMLVNKLIYNELSSCILSEVALIPPRQLFRFVHWIPFLPNANAQTFDRIRHLQLRIAFSLNEQGLESGFLDAINKEDITRFQEFRDWFGGLRSVRFQIGFWGGKIEMPPDKKNNVVRRIMKCVNVFQRANVLIYVEPEERTMACNLAIDD
ncbi:hypothetical protein N431DRAFT_514339 [Stipitochalara longipes BDJ]|nr:hypothetical protein N431DRAFT_514339 [Stipitochalara longipes BDJ]